MKRSKSRPLSLEILEDRCCPSVTAHVIDGNLHVTDDQSFANVLIRQVGRNTFAVADNGVAIGRYQVTGGVICNLSATGAAAAVDLGGYVSPGDISIYLGDGANSASVNDGSVGGKLKIVGGKGIDQVVLGAAGAPLTVLGDTCINLGAAADSLTINGNVKLSSDLVAASVNTLLMKAGSEVDGSTFISGAAAGTNYVELQGTIEHVLRFDGNALQNNTLKVDSGAVIGEFWAEVSTGKNEVDMYGAVRDNLYIFGQGTDTINLNGSIAGHAYLHLVGTDETAHLSGTINGGLALKGGAGTVNVKFADLRLNGAGSVNLGSGNDTFTMGQNVSFQAETLTVSGGKGDDTYIGSTQGVITKGFEHYE